MKREGTAEPSPCFPAYNEFRRLSGTRVGVPLAAARRRARPVRLRRGVPLRRAALHTRRPGAGFMNRRRLCQLTAAILTSDLTTHMWVL